jgi:hypothetical protein
MSYEVASRIGSDFGCTSWRFGDFLFPFWTLVPNGEFDRHMHIRGWVPLDDEHTSAAYRP